MHAEPRVRHTRLLPVLAAAERALQRWKAPPGRPGQPRPHPDIFRRQHRLRLGPHRRRAKHVNWGDHPFRRGQRQVSGQGRAVKRDTR